MAMQIRSRLAFYLEDIETPLGKTINLLITGLVLLSSAIFVAETYPLPDRIRGYLDLIDLGILIAFGIEYLVRFWVSERKIAYVFSLFSLIDLMAILPLLIGLANISFIRIFRWFRILRLIRFLEGKTLLGTVSSDDSLILTRILFTLIAIIFVYSGLIYQVEHTHNSQDFGTFLDAVYFSIATMTTVGFGDVVPASQLGRLLASLMILTGVILIPWQVGDLIKQLVKTTTQVSIPCLGCGLSQHDANARFCKQCGSHLPDPTSASGSLKE